MNLKIYKLLRPLIEKVLFIIYKPKIIGLENIPNDKKIVFVCNSHDDFDIKFLNIISKRYINFLDNEIITEDVMGLFIENEKNYLNEDFIKLLYEDYFEDIDYEEFKNNMLINKVKLSQIKTLENIFLDKKISKVDFLISLYNPSKSLIEFYNKKIITKREYYNSLLLKFDYEKILKLSTMKDTTIIPVVISGEYIFGSKNLIVRFGKEINNISDDVRMLNKEIRNEMISMLKKNLKDTNNLIV